MNPFDWASISSIGDELIQADDEAHLRSAFNRYYHGPYGCAKSYLSEFEHIIKPASHENLYRELQESDDINEQKLGEILEELFKKRADADYLDEKDGENLDLKYFQRELSNVHFQSKLAIKLVLNLKSEPPKARLEALEYKILIESAFDEKFEDLKNTFTIKRDDEVREFLKKHINAFKLLDELKSYLEKYFGDEKYLLVVRCYPEIWEKELTVVIKVDYSKEDIKELNERLMSVKQAIHKSKNELNLFGKFFVTTEGI